MTMAPRTPLLTATKQILFFSGLLFFARCRQVAKSVLTYHCVVVGNSPNQGTGRNRGLEEDALDRRPRRVELLGLARLTVTVNILL